MKLIKCFLEITMISWKTLVFTTFSFEFTNNNGAMGVLKCEKICLRVKVKIK